MAIRLPTENDRLVIIGRTGGGKTLAGLWHLSMQPLDEFTWVVLDFKGDKNLAQIPYAQRWTRFDEIPETGGGLYIVSPTTADLKHGALDDFLRLIWERGETGIYADEGVQLKNSDAFADIQMQGRSKLIPTITCTQLPVYLPRPVFTEANYIQLFYVLDKRYRKIIEEFTPVEAEDLERLNRYWSYYYDVIDNTVTLLKPGPTMDYLIPRFAELLAPPDDINESQPKIHPTPTYQRNPI